MSWSPEECRGLGEPPGDRHALCARLVEKPHGGSPESGPGPIVTRTASGPALAFWQAVLAGDVGSVSRILADSSNGLAPDSIFDTSDPERWRDFRFNILRLRRRARPDSAPGGRTALHEACAAGHAACVHVLLVAGADPNIPDQDGRRPLHLCGGAGSLECADLLLRFGAKVDGRSEEEEETPLHVAARLGHVELADLLLRRGACPDARDVEELLLARGVGANAMDYGGHTALHCAQGPAAALAQSPERTVRALLNHGAVRVWPGALPKVLERWCTSPRTIEVLMNTYSVVKLPEDAVGLVPPETLQKHHRFYSSLFALVRQPRSLQHLSRCALRAHLAACLPHALPRLPLPPRLLRYLQLDFEDVLY
nr:PREDICTED: ankyrin repeat and SOCS box protein 10 [Bos mutus]